MHTLRTRFANDIVTEFLPPKRFTKKTRVIIFADGMPTVPSKKHLLAYFSQKGFWVFHPRYRGSWESNGKFLARSPHEDILDVIDGIHKNFVSIWDQLQHKKPFRIKPDEIYLVGGSFGGPAMILASQDKRVNKALVFSPVIDWTKSGKSEPLDILAKFTEQAFGNGYRVASNGWKKLASGKFYNPIQHVNTINGPKLLIVHAKDDMICPYNLSKKFAEETQAKLVTIPSGGHFSSSLLLKPRFQKLFQKFIKN